MVIKKVLVSKYFTKEAFLQIKAELQGYSVEQVSRWESDSSATALIIRSKDLVSKDLLSKFPLVKIIVSATSGFDHFDLKLLKNHPNLTTCYSPNANISAASELTIFHILNFLKQGAALLNDKPLDRSSNILGSELSKKKVLIIGLGRIGSQVSKILNSFECEVLAYDPYAKQPSFTNAGAKKIELEEGLRAADIISLHCPLTKLTRSILNESAFSMIKKQGLVVNCARGSLICTDALIKALKAGSIGGACLDVFDQEPLSSSSPLLNFENVITTPHIGGYTAEAQKKSALEAAQQVKKWFEADVPVLSLVPPDVAWKKDL